MLRCSKHAQGVPPLEPESAGTTLMTRTTSILSFVHGTEAFRAFLLKRPICESCCLEILKNVQRVVEEENRIASMVSIFEATQGPRNPVEPEDESERLALESQLAEIEQQQLETERELEVLEEELRALRPAAQQLNNQSAEFFRELQEQEIAALRLQDEIASAREKSRSVLGDIERLGNFGVYDAIFPINLESEPAWICGFRFGSTTDDPTPKFELNSAFGQYTLLLFLLIRHLHLKIHTPRLFPLGNRSLIDTGQAMLPLWTKSLIDFSPKSGIASLQISRLWGGRSQYEEFEHGLSALLGCLSAVTTELARDFGMKWDYVFTDVTIGLVDQHPCPITVKSNSPKAWNSALRYS